MKFVFGTWSLVGTAGFSPGGTFHTSLAIDSAGTPFVAFTDSSTSPSGKVTVMKYTGSGASGWVLVGDAGFSSGAASYTSLALDATGTPYVAFRDNGNDDKATVMKYLGGVAQSPSGWDVVGTAGFSPGGASQTSLVVTGTGMPYVAFLGNLLSNKATIMKYDGSWNFVGTRGFSSGDVDYISLALSTTTGRPYVAFQQGSQGKATVMKYGGGGAVSSTGWDAVGTDGFTPGRIASLDLALDSADTPYVAVRDLTSDAKATVMKYAGSASGWVLVGAAGFSPGSGGINYINLALNSAGTPFVAFKDYTNGKATAMEYTG